ncbi:Mns1, partial [Symbiodinium sp. CCMP2456]
ARSRAVSAGPAGARAPPADPAEPEPEGPLAAPFRRPRASTPVPRFAPAPRDRAGGVAEVLGQGLAEGGFQPPARVPARSRASSVAMSRRDAGS